MCFSECVSAAGPEGSVPWGPRRNCRACPRIVSLPGGGHLPTNMLTEGCLWVLTTQYLQQASSTTKETQ